MRSALRLASIAAAVATASVLVAQTSAPRYYSRVHLTGMEVKATVRQMVSHPYWGCLPGQFDGFNPDYYGTFNEDVVEAHYPLLQHYVDYGRREGRRPCDPAGRTEFQPDDEFTRLLPRTGTRDIVATASHDYYELPDGAADLRVSIDGFDVEADKLSLSFIIARYGMPTTADLGQLGTDLSWPSGTHIKLVGVKIEDARKVVVASAAAAGIQ